MGVEKVFRRTKPKTKTHTLETWTCTCHSTMTKRFVHVSSVLYVHMNRALYLDPCFTGTSIAAFMLKLQVVVVLSEIAAPLEKLEKLRSLHPATVQLPLFKAKVFEELV